MIQTLKGPAGEKGFRTVTCIGSCSQGERSTVPAGKQRGLFADALAEAFSGRADKKHLGKLNAIELFDYLSQSIPAAARTTGHPQTPQLFLPDNRPPRLSADAKKAIRVLADRVAIGESNLKDLKGLCDEATRLAGSEVEPKLLYGLVLLKSKQRESLAYFESLKADQPNLLLGLEALTWLRFEKRGYAAAVSELTELVSKIPRPRGDPYPPATAQIFTWAGQLREFTASAADARPVPDELIRKLDAAVAARGEEMTKLYEQGREQTRSTLREFDEKIDAATDEATKSRLRIYRTQVTHYAAFPLDAALHTIVAGLEK